MKDGFKSEPSDSPASPSSADSTLQIEEAREVIAELRRSEARLKALLEHMPDAYYLHDMNGIFLDGNRAAEMVTGYARDELVGHSFFDSALLSADQLEKAAEGLGKSFRGEPTGPDEYILTRKNGSSVPVEIRAFPVDLDDQQVVLGLARDITRRKRNEAELERYRERLEDLVEVRTRELQKTNATLEAEIEERKRSQQALRHSEERLQRSQRMETVGRLAGGIAHDFNNVLSGIVGFADLVLMSLSEDDRSRPHVEEILRSSERATRLTRQLLAFSRRQVLAPQVLSLNDSIRDLERLLQRLLGEQAELSMDLDRSLWPVRVDQGQMEQVLVNLVVNARDAMEKGGQVRIRTENIALAQPLEAETISEVEPGDWVVLEVQDEGCGMDPLVLSQIFEPFFTTKEPGRGTGLGLSTVFGIVKQSRGHIVVDSAPEEGTAFRIYLPKALERVERPPVLAERRKELPPGSGTVLVVEDDDTVRRLVRLVLSAKGYRVLEAPNGEAALEVCIERRTELDLIITDIVMPKMTGPTLVERAAELSPGVRVLFMSGYSDHEELVEREEQPILRKPFTPRQLVEVVHELLRGG